MLPSTMGFSRARFTSSPNWWSMKPPSTAVNMTRMHTCVTGHKIERLQLGDSWRNAVLHHGLQQGTLHVQPRLVVHEAAQHSCEHHSHAHLRPQGKRLSQTSALWSCKAKQGKARQGIWWHADSILQARHRVLAVSRVGFPNVWQTLSGSTCWRNTATCMSKVCSHSFHFTSNWSKATDLRGGWHAEEVHVACEAGGHVLPASSRRRTRRHHCHVLNALPE